MQIASDDARIFYEMEGNGPPLVLLHPYPTNHNFWKPMLGALSARYQVIVPDLRAQGLSEPGAGPATMQKHAADLARICMPQQLSAQFSSASLLADICSLNSGGNFATACALSSYATPVRKPILLNPEIHACNSPSR